MSSNEHSRLEYIYQEYTRLSDKCEDFIQGTYDDFKLLGATGAIVIVWKPLSEAILPTNSPLNSGLITFLGFLSLLTIMGLIALVNLIKQSYAWYFVHHLQAYEQEIRTILCEAETSQIFSFNLDKAKPKFVTASYRLAYRAFAIVFTTIVTLLPCIVLLQVNALYAFLYGAITLLGFTLYLQIFRRVMKQYSTLRLL